MFDKIWKKQIYILLLVIIGIVVFIKVLDFGFVWDDNQLYLNKGNYPEDGRLQNISKLWQPGKMPMYAPVTYTMWGIIAQLSSTDDSNDFKLNPKLFHFVNLLFHILNSVLILLIISRLLKDNLAAFIAGLIFLLHPIQVESVAWISEFRGLLAGFFGFLAVYIHLTTITGAEFVAAHKTTKKNN